MGTPTITKGNQHSSSTLYEGNGTAIGSGGKTISGLSFKPDLVWIKNRDATDDHSLFDSSRGVTKLLETTTSPYAETTQTESLTSFTGSGYTLGSLAQVNTSSESFVSWNWKANGGTTASNTNGSITSTVQANTTAGFSIVTYSGSDASTVTWGHGLSSSPEWVLIKRREGNGWRTYHTSVGLGSYLSITNSNGPTTSSTDFASVSSTTFGVKGGNNPVSASSQTYVAYCWHGVEGFSKFNTYTGNGNADGPFTYTNFKPAWVMIKRTDSAGDWCILDNKRNAINPADNVLKANLSAIEDDDANMAIDFVSNGFKIRGAGSDGDNINASGGTYVYMAFAEAPFFGDGVSPVTAR
tara:strand:- start:242 stop:1303 length:1062 start_codon:yes stop_codon:yes gene_type:complete